MDSCFRRNQIKKNSNFIGEEFLSEVSLKERKKTSTLKMSSKLTNTTMDNNKSQVEKSIQRSIKDGKALVEKLKSSDVNTVKDEVVECLNRMVEQLAESSAQVQQLKFKNLLLTNKVDTESESRFEVEENLKKQQFERLKSQLYTENIHLSEQLKIKDSKVTKYKKKIVAKNHHINQLMRLLNQSPAVFDSSQSESSMISTQKEDTEEADTTIPITESVKKPRQLKNETHMLQTLGMLATHVLKDENKSAEASPNGDETRIEDDDSVNRTIIQSAVKTGNDTELEIDRSPSYGRVIPPLQTTGTKEDLHNLRVVLPSIPRPELKLDVKLPIMKRFNTLDGSVKDISY